MVWCRAFRCAASLLALTLPLVACESAQQPEPLFGNRILKAPPKMGSSITHTQMCECKACEPSECCAGDIGETDGNRAECKDSYDFSKEGCGLKVSSCSARCTRHIWRIKLSESCEATQPLACC